MNLVLFLVSLALLAPSRAHAQASSIPSVQEALERAAQGESAAPKVPEADAVVHKFEAVSAERIQDTARMQKLSREYFDAYMEKDSLPRLLYPVAKRKFLQGQEWTVPFMQKRFDRLSLSLETRSFRGRKRPIMVSETEYRGYKITFLRFREVTDSVTYIEADGRLELGEDGKPLCFITKSKEDFDEFEAWFDKRFGKPR